MILSTLDLIRLENPLAHQRRERPLLRLNLLRNFFICSRLCSSIWRSPVFFSGCSSGSLRA